MQLNGIRRFAIAPLAALVLGSALLAAPQGASADQRDFRLVNESSSTIMRLYVSPASADRWGADQLGDDVVRPGSTFTLRFSEGQFQNRCVFDLRIVNASGSATEERGVNLCSTSTVTYW
jgi:hypothetical protein